MRAYILSIAGVVLLAALVSIILPSGKMGKFIKGAMKLFVLIVLVSPFVSGFGTIAGEENTPVYETDADYLKRCARMLSAEDEKQILKWIEEEYSLEAAVSVTRKEESGFPREKITVKILQDGIIANDEHIDIMKKIQGELQTKYACPAEVT